VNTTRRHYAAMTDDRRRMAARRVHVRGDEVTDDVTADDSESPLQR